ncbi:MAG: M67 family metallopeptidase [Pseudomonadota bacterium]
MEICVTSEAIETVRAQERAAHPHECCGLLLGEVSSDVWAAVGRITRAVPTANVHARPATGFEIDPQALIDAHRAQREGGPRLLGYYHSHPTGDPRPSVIDAANAPGDGMIWAICAAGDVQFWRDTPAGFKALSCSHGDR